MPSLRTTNLVLFFSLAACTSSSLEDLDRQQSRNVYGNDNRQEWYDQSPNLSANQNATIKRLGQESVGLFVPSPQIRPLADNKIMLCATEVEHYPPGTQDGCFLRTLDWKVWASDKYGHRIYPACLDEPFRLQPQLWGCSATLIAEDLVLTAGHCFDEAKDIHDKAFVFNWRYDHKPNGPGDIDFRTTTFREVAFWVQQPIPGIAAIAQDDVYRVTRAHFVLEYQNLVHPNGGTTSAPRRDYAIVQLDRPVSLPRRPVAIDYSDLAPPAGTALVAANFGGALPLKIDDHAKVIDSWYCDPKVNPDQLCTVHDAYGGSSGGGLFEVSERDAKLVATHRGSQRDFVFDPVGKCYRSTVVPDVVPNWAYPATAHLASRAVKDFCNNGFAPNSPICGDSSYHRDKSTDCPDGALSSSIGTEVCCQKACTTDSDCAVDDWRGSCNESGYCRREGQCFAGEMWERDACGRPSHRLTESSELCAPLKSSCERAESLAIKSQKIPLVATSWEDLDQGSCSEPNGNEQVWMLEPSTAYDITLRIEGPTLGWSLYLRGPDCHRNNELECKSSAQTNDISIRRRLEPGRYYLFAERTAGNLSDTTANSMKSVLSVAFDAPQLERASDRDSGCSCRISRRSYPYAGWLVVLGLSAIGFRRRRCCRRNLSYSNRKL